MEEEQQRQGIEFEDDIDIKAALMRPTGKSATSKQITSRPVCPACNLTLEIRTIEENGKIVGQYFYCERCQKKITEPKIAHDIIETPLALNEQFTRDSTTGFYEPIDSLIVDGLDDLCLATSFIQQNYGLNLQPSHDYFVGKKTKVSTISKSHTGALVQAMLTKKVETTEKLEQNISDTRSEREEKKGFFGTKKGGK